MNKVILENDLNNKDLKFFIKKISLNKSDFEISNSNFLKSKIIHL